MSTPEPDGIHILYQDPKPNLNSPPPLPYIVNIIGLILAIGVGVALYVNWWYIVLVAPIFLGYLMVWHNQQPYNRIARIIAIDEAAHYLIVVWHHVAPFITYHGEAYIDIHDISQIISHRRNPAHILSIQSDNGVMQHFRIPNQSIGQQIYGAVITFKTAHHGQRPEPTSRRLYQFESLFAALLMDIFRSDNHPRK